MKWYREHLRLTILSIILILLLTLTIASYVHQGSNSWLGGQIQKVNTFIQEPVSNAGNSIINTFKGLFLYKSIMEENEALKQENARLKREVIRNSLSQADLTDLKSLSEALNFDNPADNHSYVAASVVSMDGSQWYRIFTINEGTEKGIHKNSVVINSDGLIGRVLDVGENWAKVISITDENNDVSFMTFRDLGLLGILTGDGKGGLKGYMLDEKASVIEGDVLITSGMELYPRGIPIGKITAVKWDDDALLRSVSIEPAVDFTNIQKVIVIVTEQSEQERQ